MKKQILFSPLSATLLGLLLILFSFCRNKFSTEQRQQQRAYRNCKVLYYQGNTPIKVCFAPGEVITNTTYYSQSEEDSLFNYLIRLGLSPVDTCDCAQKLIRWGTENPQLIDIIGTVADAPRTGKPSGDTTTGISLNYIITPPEAQSTYTRKIKPKTRGPFDSTKPKVFVTILDTGVDTGQYFLARNLESYGAPTCNGTITDTGFGLDVTNNSMSTFPIDWIGHGTHVNGIVINALSKMENDENIRLRNVKVSEGKSDTIYLFSVLCGMYYAAEKDQNLDVINCSLGWIDNEMPEAMRPLLKMLDQRGVVVVAGVGNNGQRQDTNSKALFWPAAFSHSTDSSGRNMMISVGALVDTPGTRQKIWRNSNWGDYVDVYAPGVSILSTYLEDEVSGDSLTVAKCSGTSMAGPFVTNMIAKIKATNPNLSALQVKTCIMNSATIRRLRRSPFPFPILQRVRVLDRNTIIRNCGD